MHQAVTQYVQLYCITEVTAPDFQHHRINVSMLPREADDDSWDQQICFYFRNQSIARGPSANMPDGADPLSTGALHAPSRQNPIAPLHSHHQPGWQVPVLYLCSSHSRWHDFIDTVRVEGVLLEILSSRSHSRSRQSKHIMISSWESRHRRVVY
jgi:hypothetical protein